MDVQATLFGFFGGLGLFLYGMKLMSDGLKKTGSDSIKKVLHTLTKNRVAAIIVGLGITCLIQSSSATSVMVVGLVNAGLLAFGQAVAVVLGADIGTTITAWIVSALGIGKFKISTYALPIIFVGFLVNFVAKSRQRQMIGQALLGFGLLFLGLGTMSEGLKSIKESSMIMEFFQTYGSNPFLGILAGTLVTAIVQSSSVTIAIIQLMAFQGIFGLEAALPLMFGADIGTTITAQLAAIGGTKAARGVAMANTIFKAVGATLFMPLLLLGWLQAGAQLIVPDQFDPETGNNSAIMVQIALTHTAYIAVNVIIFSTALWGLLIKTSRRAAAMGDEDTEQGERRHLDPLLLDTPPIAVEQCIKELSYMVGLCHENITAAFMAFIDRDLGGADKIEERENEIDLLQKEITAYVVQISQRDLAERESAAIPRLVHCINDAERIGDHAENIVEVAELSLHSKLVLSLEARRELHNYFDLVDRQFKAVRRALDTRDPEAVKLAMQLEDQINEGQEDYTLHHIQRLEQETCTVNSGLTFLDMIGNLEKIGDHLTNIAERLDVAKQPIDEQRAEAQP